MHGATFTFSNGSGGKTTLPYNGVPFPGPQVTPFQLNITPPAVVALPHQPVTYQATYISSANKPPTVTDVDIDGVPHKMTSTGGTNYAKGVTYTYTTNTLPVGDHWYRYRFDDSANGSDVAIYEGSVKPEITTILLSHSSVSQTAGSGSTVFTFQTTYTNVLNIAPTQALLYVDNQSHPMSRISGSYTTGALYQAKLTLPTGKHAFFFVFQDNQTSWADPFAPGAFAGPNVGAGAAPIKPGTIIISDQGDEDNPDMVQEPDGDGYDPN
jgi:hypothetical protein